MKKILLGFCLILLSLPTLAKTVSGTVIDSETGETVPYASIVYYEGNTPYGGETDNKGNFSLTVPDNKPITVTLIGYEDKTISNPTENMTIDLDLDKDMLDEAVITSCKNNFPNKQKKYDEKTDKCYPIECDKGYELIGAAPNTKCQIICDPNQGLKVNPSTNKCVSNKGDDCLSTVKAQVPQATKATYGNNGKCEIQTCEKGYIANEDKTTCIKSEGDCTDTVKQVDPNASAGELQKGICIPTACEKGYELKNKKCENIVCEEPRYKYNEETGACEDLKNKDCINTLENKSNVVRAIYQIQDKELKCVVKKCADGFLPNDYENGCEQSEGACTSEQLSQIFKATEGQLKNGKCKATKCEEGYEVSKGKCVESEVSDVEPATEEEIAELQAKADEAKANEQSIANTLLGGAGIGATGIGGMMATSALAEQSADAAAELDMSGYIATFRCTYGSYQAKGGDANITLPGANILLPLYTEYQQLAADLKQRKEALNMSPGIESEVVMDKATSGLYDDTSIGITNGTYASVYRALTNTSGEDAAQLSEQAEKTKSNLTAGAITAGVGAGGSIVGNLIINNPKDAQNNTEQENTNAVNQQM